MTRFSATTDSAATVPAPAAAIWALLTDPVKLTEMTPLLDGIDADGDTWRWRMHRISALGVGVSAEFTEQMTFEQERHIGFRHAPPPGSHERAGAEGSYDLRASGDGTHLSISLTVEVELPLPRAAAPAVSRVMRGTMARMGDRFSANLLAALGV